MNLEARLIKLERSNKRQQSLLFVLFNPLPVKSARSKSTVKGIAQ